MIAKLNHLKNKNIENKTIDEKISKLPNLNILPETFWQLLLLYYIFRATCEIAKTLHSFNKYVSYRLIFAIFVYRLNEKKRSCHLFYIFLKRILIPDSCLSESTLMFQVLKLYSSVLLTDDTDQSPQLRC